MSLDFLEKIKSQLGKSLPLVAYRKPREANARAIFQSDDGLRHLKSYSESGFIFAPFDTVNPTILIHPDETLISSELPSPEGEKVEMTVSESRSILRQENKTAHLQLVGKAIREIANGSFRKVVLSRKIETPLKTSAVMLFQRLLAEYPNAFCYLWYHPKVGIWLGATPEILLRVRNRQFITMSLAGTQKLTQSEPIEWADKELEEQEMVTNYILDALKDRVTDVKRSDTETVRAGNLLHLRTRISGYLETGNPEAIVNALHPTPAVCGLPKETAQKFIAQNENYDREYYTGFLGELNLSMGHNRSSNTKNQENRAYRSIAKTTTLYVNLRCMKLGRDKAFIYAGGGITKDSDPEQEWEETVAKSRTMLSILK